MNRVLVTIGPVTVYWYSFLVLVAVLVGYQIVINYAKKMNYHVNAITDMALYLVIWSIIGARLYYVIFHFDLFQDNFIGVFQIWRGGLAIYGGIIGGTLYVLYYSIRKHLSFIKILDIYSLSLLLGQAIGRWGNFFNQEAYGGETTYEALKGLFIPDFIIQGMKIEGVYRQPTFLYESIWCFIGVIVLYIMRRKITTPLGKQISFYLCWYGFGRFFIEGLRSDSLYVGMFRISQIVSLIIFVVGVIGLIYIKRKNMIRVKDVGGVSGRI